ncbi:MAG: Gfo/Idh/MocA family oxidoreductase, partial [Chloroflexi bacterium]|nr:Gfo/Idh/MocA family oxidoreductase [Chloroflexota bacterium]
GCGQIAQIAHLPYLQELPQFEIGALCDRSSRVLAALSEKYRVQQCFTDYLDLVRQTDLDAVLVTNKNHAPVILAALNEGKHVLVEKPMVFNLKQADEVIQAARTNKRVLMVAYMKRYDPGYQYAQKIIQGMDSIYLIRMHDFAGTYQINNEIYDLVYPTDLSEELAKTEQEQIANGLLGDIGADQSDYLSLYDILMHLTIHDINVMNGIFGIPQVKYAKIHHEVFMNAVLEYPGGVQCMWESGNSVDLMDWDEQLWVYGKDRRVELRFPFPYLRNAATMVNVNQMEGATSVDKRVLVSFDEAFRREWLHFYQCVTEGHEPVTGPEEARKDIEFTAGLFRSAMK